MTKISSINQYFFKYSVFWFKISLVVWVLSSTYNQNKRIYSAQSYHSWLSKSSEPVISNWKPKHKESAERAEKRMWEFFDWFYFHFLLDCFFVYLLIAFNCWLSLRNHVFFIGERTRLLILGLWHKRRKNRSWKPWVCRKVTGSGVPRDTSTPLVNAVVLWREAGVMNAGLWLVEQITD